jgi:hypothetical protein
LSKKFGVLYNSQHGGFNFSHKMIALYNKKTKKKFKLIYKNDSDYYQQRFDPILIECFNELGSKKSSGPYCELTVEYFSNQYKSCIQVYGYDGAEELFIDYTLYIRKLIKKINLENASRQELYDLLTNIKLEIQNYKPNFFYT